jgi:hypothetical protein
VTDYDTYLYPTNERHPQIEIGLLAVLAWYFLQIKSILQSEARMIYTPPIEFKYEFAHTSDRTRLLLLRYLQSENVPVISHLTLNRQNILLLLNQYTADTILVIPQTSKTTSRTIVATYSDGILQETGEPDHIESLLQAAIDTIGQLLIQAGLSCIKQVEFTIQYSDADHNPQIADIQIIDIYEIYVASIMKELSVITDTHGRCVDTEDQVDGIIYHLLNIKKSIINTLFKTITHTDRKFYPEARELEIETAQLSYLLLTIFRPSTATGGK